MERVCVPLGRDTRKDRLRARTSSSIPPYSDSDSTAVEDEVPVEGGGEESLDRRVEGEDIVSDGEGIGTGGRDIGAGSSVCSR